MAGKRNQKLKVITYFPDPEGTHIHNGIRYKLREELTPEEHERWKKIISDRLTAAIVRRIAQDPAYGKKLLECGMIHD